MKFLITLLLSTLYFGNLVAEISHQNFDILFNVGKMESYNKEFTLYFKPRNKAILARGEERNYIKDYPQDLYIYIHKTKEDVPLISYEWFPRAVKNMTKHYKYPVFPEDFAYYLLEDNNTLVMINTKKKNKKNFEFNISKKELSIHKNSGKIDFIISTLAKSCGFKNLTDNYECNFYKPLVSTYIFN